MTAHLGSVDQARLTRAGFVPITTEHGLALFDTALAYQQPALITSPVNTAALARLARRNALPAILSGLTRTRPQAATASPETLTTRLAAQTPEQQLATLTTLVTTTTATVLAHPDPAALDPDRPFKDLGIDSLTALELRNSLATQTGLTLPATLVFDHPTPAATRRAPDRPAGRHRRTRAGTDRSRRGANRGADRGGRDGVPVPRGGGFGGGRCGIWWHAGVDAVGGFPD